MNVLVLGCGRVGSGVARELASRGVGVVVVDPDPDALARLGDGYPGGKLLGSALDRSVLVAGGISEVDGLAAVTGRDEVNVVLAHAARRTFHVPSVVARLHDPGLVALHRRLGIRTLAPVAWGVRRIADLLTATTVETVAALGTGAVDLVEVTVPTLLDGRPVTELEVPGELSVVSVTQHGRTALPVPGTVLRGGDLVHLVVAAAAHGRLEALLGQREG